MQYAVNVETAVHRDGRYLLVERSADEDHAAGTLALVGGTVESTDAADALERTLDRELREEVDVAATDHRYVLSGTFVADDDVPVVNTVFVSRYDRGTPRVAEPEEVASVGWYTVDEALNHPALQSWTEEHLEAVDEMRRELGW